MSCSAEEASSGRADTPINVGWTAQSLLNVPLHLADEEMPICNIGKNSGCGRMLQQCSCFFEMKIACNVFVNTDDLKNHVYPYLQCNIGTKEWLGEIAILAATNKTFGLIIKILFHMWNMTLCSISQ